MTTNYVDYVFAESGENQAKKFLRDLTFSPETRKEQIKQITQAAWEQIKVGDLSTVGSIQNLLLILHASVDLNKTAHQKVIFALLENNELLRQYFVRNILNDEKLKIDQEVTALYGKKEDQKSEWQKIFGEVEEKLQDIITKLTNKFLGYQDQVDSIPGNPFIGQTFFETCPKAVALLSPEALTVLALKNTGMAFVIFEDVALSEKLLTYLKEQHSFQEIAVYFAKLLANAPERLDSVWQDYFYRIFKFAFEHFPTEISYLLEAGTGIALDPKKPLAGKSEAEKGILITIAKIPNLKTRIQDVFFRNPREELLALTEAATLKKNPACKAPYFIAMREIQEHQENFREHFIATYNTQSPPSNALVRIVNSGEKSKENVYQRVYQALTSYSFWYGLKKMLLSWSYQPTSIPLIRSIGVWFANTAMGKSFYEEFKQRTAILNLIAPQSAEKVNHPSAVAKHDSSSNSEAIDRSESQSDSKLEPAAIAVELDSPSEMLPAPRVDPKFGDMSRKQFFIEGSGVKKPSEENEEEQQQENIHSMTNPQIAELR